jgi:hypothetical protein
MDKVAGKRLKSTVRGCSPSDLSILVIKCNFWFSAIQPELALHPPVESSRENLEARTSCADVSACALTAGA